MRIATLLAMATVAACTAQNTPQPSASATVQWDSATAGEVRSVVQQGVDAFSRLDLEGVKAVLSQDWTSASFETDFENKPLRLATREDAVKYAEDTFGQVKQMGATLKIDLKNMDCRGTSTLGYCEFDTDVVATMPKGAPMVQPGRATVVVAKGADGWKWVHWHSSPGPAAAASK
jgi:ketosteroid isomerase-like protein